ncbi:phytoene desaturase family protein [Deinococcus aquiradiocola]|uniref:Dehydrogenase n=1 Tax=Deinococcus aquiradiocola TaxID=393059 RepID=A0A917UKI6_9DEIO|nr:NAD(P)/FAD-dependent oxidoreductase [Deinococcus aquiradiocola]GGJ64024.1 dehydrogenase [Deinococcus aquiradiocola]
MPSARVAVIGAGVSGLTLAALLAQRGHRVTVYERDRPGGKLRRETSGDLTFDTGPSLFTFPEVWRRVLARLGEKSDPLDLYPLPGGLGVHHTPHGPVPLPVPAGHALHAEWERYAAEVRPLRPHVLTLLTTPPSLTHPAFLRASAALLRVTGPHLTAGGWLRARIFPPALHHALAVHALNAGQGPDEGSVLYALLPALMADDVFRPWRGMGAVLDALLGYCAARGVQLRSGEPVTSLHALPDHDLTVSAVDPARVTALRGLPVPRGPLSVSGLALYAPLPDALHGRLPATSVVTPDDYPAFAAAMRARALPPSTLALVHADPQSGTGRAGRLALLLTVPPTGRDLPVTHPWVQSQLRRVAAALGTDPVTLLPAPGPLISLGPQHYAQGGAPGGAIYGTALPAWRSGPLHPQPYRLTSTLWQVGTGVHPGGGLPAVLGSALIVDTLLRTHGH